MIVDRYPWQDIEVSLLDQSNSETFDTREWTREDDPFEKDRKSLTNILLVPDKTSFKLRVKIGSNFQWNESDCLHVRIHLGKSNVEFRLRCIFKPDPPQEIIKEYNVINAWNAEQQKWKEFTPKFSDMKVSTQYSQAD